MKKRILFLTLILAGAFMLAAIDASACTACHKKESDQNECKMAKLKSVGKLLWSNKDFLGLTEEQLNKIKDIKHSGLKDLIRLNAEVEVLEIDLQSEMWEPQIAVETVNGLLDQKFAVKNKIAKTFVQAVADMQQVLSEEQRGKALKLAKQAKEDKEKCGKFACGKCSKSDCGKCPKTADGEKFCPITGKILKSDKAPMKATGKGM